jgi:hypothetical protein
VVNFIFACEAGWHEVIQKGEERRGEEVKKKGVPQRQESVVPDPESLEALGDGEVWWIESVPRGEKKRLEKESAIYSVLEDRGRLFLHRSVVSKEVRHSGSQYALV